MRTTGWFFSAGEIKVPLLIILLILSWIYSLVSLLFLFYGLVLKMLSIDIRFPILSDLFFWEWVSLAGKDVFRGDLLFFSGVSLTLKNVELWLKMETCSGFSSSTCLMFRVFSSLDGLSLLCIWVTGLPLLSDDMCIFDIYCMLDITRYTETRQ